MEYWNSGLLRFIMIPALVLVTLKGGAEGVTLLAPRDGMEITDVATYFQWSPVSGCSNFVVQVAKDSTFAELVINKQTRNKGYHKNLYFPKNTLPAGRYHWRVRPDLGKETWSPAFSFTVNEDHPIRPPVREISPARPIFMMRNRAWDPVKYAANVDTLIPTALRSVIINDDLVLSRANDEALARASKYEELGLDFVVWDNRCQVSLAYVEYLFQNFKHCIGIAEGEHFSGMYWEKGPEGNLAESDYVHRAWTLAAKYGRFYFFADGDGGSYRWPAFTVKEKEVMLRYRQALVPMFKTTNGDMALHTYGAMSGILAAGYSENTGVWVDEWIWPCCGFGKLGEIIPEEKIWSVRRSLGTKQCPWMYDIQMWLMGIASGATVFHLESAHQFTKEGLGAKNYNQVFLPFIRAVLEHQLIPSRQAYLESIKVAVQSDLALATAAGRHQKQYTGDFEYLKKLYALEEQGDREFIPNESRYGILTLLPPDAKPVRPETIMIPQREMKEPASIAIFEKAYPKKSQGQAFTWRCDGTIIITNSEENKDAEQTYEIPLKAGLVQSLRGQMGVHQFLIAKEGKQDFWFQVNGEYRDRVMRVALQCTQEPSIKIAPVTAGKKIAWNPSTACVELELSITEGAVEVTVGKKVVH
jgi:hypothetical protein